MSIVKISIKKASYLKRLCMAYKLSKTKFGYACMKNEKKLDDALESFNESLEDKRREFASVDEKGNLLVDEKANYCYSKENRGKLDDFFKKESNKEVEIDFYKCIDITSVKDNVALLADLNGTIVDIDEEAMYCSTEESKDESTSKLEVVK